MQKEKKNREVALRKKIKALIFDLDGVITQTASVHARAWQKMFEKYNHHREQDGQEPFTPYRGQEDYLEYIDGKPRYDGARDFLQSRGIELPEGEPEDEPGYDTVCALGNLKNDIFQGLLREEGFRTYQAAVTKIREFRKEGFKTAIISASKNCRLILEEAGIAPLFDERVDGVTAEGLGLDGKPAPDIFLEAARRLNVHPDEVAIFEDALAGVAAGKSGKFGQVIGLARSNEPARLREEGADAVIHSFEELRSYYHSFEELPSAIGQFETIQEKLPDGEPLLFLDYDGTLTPIVSQPEDANLSEEMKQLLRQAAETAKVAVVSGRDMRDVEQRVGLKELYYAGSHGFEVNGPGGLHFEYEKGKEILPVLDKAEETLKQELGMIEGVRVERKRYAIAVHYRNVAGERADEVKQKAEKVLERYPRLKKGLGKKIVEFKPKLDWHKGKAVNWLVNKLQEGRDGRCPVYIGDDITDEDAFEQVRQENGIGILVGDHGELTQAQYRLADVDEVKTFLRKMLKNDTS